MGLLLSALLQRSDYLAVECGQIVVRNENSDLSDQQKQWLKVNRHELLTEILATTNTQGYQYDSYSTGQYGPHKADGLTLQFMNLRNSEEAFVVFNVDIKRTRNTRHGRKGTLLPQGQFIPGKRSRFINLWQSTLLAMPRRLSGFHDCMGKLKTVCFTGGVVDNRLSKETLKPLELSYHEILNSSNQGATSPDISPTITCQSPDNFLTKVPDKELAQSHIAQGLQQDFTTGAVNYGNTVNGNTGKGISPCLVMKDREHIDDYCKKLPQEQTVDEWLADYELSERLEKAAGLKHQYN